MKFTLSWLKDYLKTDASLNEIEEKLTAIGLEVEEVINPAAALKDFILAEVVAEEKHPDADKLKVLTVDTGSEKTQIVCGAPNARAGIKVILAQPGVVIPAFGEVLKVGKIRGVESFGMCCSEKELGLGDNHDGIIELQSDLPNGTTADKVLNVEPVIEIAITANKADCLSVRGIARDLAASGIGEYIDRDVKIPEHTFDCPVKVTIEDENCPIFTVRYLKNVKNCQSPQWMKDRLTAIGLRPINALVDITNYINFDMGHPLHVFDADKLKGDITIRSAKDGEKLLALDENEYELHEGVVTVCDENGVQSIAGIMGGVPTGCDENTVNVVLESAMFKPVAISQAGRKLKAESDSRYRFERWVDPATTALASDYAVELIQEICGGEVSEIEADGDGISCQQIVNFNVNKVEKLIGIKVEKSEMIKTLTDLGFKVTDNGETFEILTPSWRADIEGENDIVEEIVRIHGFDNIPTRFERVEHKSGNPFSVAQKKQYNAKRELALRGMYETVTWSFTNSKYATMFNATGDDIILSNPISSDLDQVRPSVLPNLLMGAMKNIARGTVNQSIFEVGPQFYGRNPNEQTEMVSGIRVGSTGDKHWAEAPRLFDFYDVKADALAVIAAVDGPLTPQITTDAPAWYHPGRSATFRLGKNVIAHFGELHPQVLKKMGIKQNVVAFEVFLDNIPTPKKAKSTTKKLLKTSDLQPVLKDMAFIADKSVLASDVINSAKSADKNLISDVRMFDVYEGENMAEGKKSLAVQIVFQPQDKTFTDKDLELLMNKVSLAVSKKTGAELRDS
jgi:phenylalanyl-tRNA synthetase beta chain